MLDQKFLLNYMQLLANLYHIKCNHPLHIMCSKCPPSAETHAVMYAQKLMSIQLSSLPHVAETEN